MTIGVFHKHRKLAMLALLPTCILMSTVFFLIAPTQGIYQYFIFRLHALFDQLMFYGRAKTKVAIMAFFCCREFVKNSTLCNPVFSVRG